MADQDIKSTATRSVPSNGGDTAFDLAFKIEESLAHSRTLNDLAMWIAEARGLIDGLRHAMSIDSELARRIKPHSLGLWGPEWGSAEVEGLQHLHMVIAENLREIASVSGLASTRVAQPA